MTDSSIDPERMSRLRARLEELRASEEMLWTEQDFQLFCRWFKRHKQATINGKLHQLRFMAREEVPVNLWGTKDAAVDTFLRYIVHREHIEDKSRAALGGDHKAFRTLCDLVGIDRKKLPVVPAEPASDVREIPSPEDVYDLIHAKYRPGGGANPENQLVRYVLAFSFAFAVRTPSEVVAMTVDDLHFDTGEITITEPKKSGRKRRLLVEPEWLLTSPTQMSLKNWLIWRDKIDPDTDQLFPRMDGTAWACKENLSSWLRNRVLDEFPWWSPNLARYWGINARLIDTGFDAYRVAKWTGHTNVNRIKDHYAPRARALEKAYGDRWVLRAFRKAVSQ